MYIDAFFFFTSIMSIMHSYYTHTFVNYMYHELLILACLKQLHVPCIKKNIVLHMSCFSLSAVHIFLFMLVKFSNTNQCFF